MTSLVARLLRTIGYPRTILQLPRPGLPAIGTPALRLSSLLAAGLLLPFLSSAQTVVYHLDSTSDFQAYAANHRDAKNTTFSVVTDANNNQGLQVELHPDVSQAGFYNYLLTPATLLQGGQQYIATIKFRIVTPTKYPDYFYMFARNSAGNEHDLWQKWIGLPGTIRTISFPIDLKTITATGGGTTQWTFNLGVKGPGAIVINSFTIAAGTNNVAVAPKAGVVAAATAAASIPEATGFTPFPIKPPAAPTTTISTDSFHLVADGPAATSATPIDNAAALQQAINVCKTKGAAKLVIPKGIYRIAATNSIQLNGINDLTLDGQGSTLIFEKLARDGLGFFIINCARVRLENLALDWDWDAQPIASLGTVSNLSADQLQCDFTFPDQNAAQTERTRTAKWAGIFAMDPVKLVSVERASHPMPRRDGKSVTSTGNVLHVTFPTPSRLIDGQTYCIRHLYYDMTAFKVMETNNFVFDQVRIYSFPGMGWLFEGAMHEYALIDCHIERGPHPRRPFTLSADGIHADSSQGNFLVQDCSFTGLGDDSINLHDNCYEGTVVPDLSDNKSLILMNCPPYQIRINPGDKLEFYNADYSPLDSTKPTTREVATVAKTAGGPNVSIKFTTPIPANLTALSIIRNTRFNNSNISIDRCKFEYTDGRGILFSGSNATIRNCNFLHSGTPFVFEAEIVPPLWEEGDGASNILIEGNKFAEITSRSRYGNAVIYAESLIPWGPTQTALFRNLSIVNNDFTSCPGPAVSLDASANVVVRANRIDCTRPSDSATRYSGTIFAMNSSNLALGGNTWITGVSSTFDSGVVYDKTNTSKVFPDVNALAAPSQTK